MIYIIYIIITNLSTDITNLSKSVSEESASNVLISGLVPRKGYLKAKLRNINNNNFLALNPKNCHFMTLGNGNNLRDFSCDDIIIKNSLSEKILGNTLDNNHNNHRKSF